MEAGRRPYVLRGGSGSALGLAAGDLALDEGVEVFVLKNFHPLE